MGYHHDIRRVGLMGSWSIHIQGGLVSADMAPILGRGLKELMPIVVGAAVWGKYQSIRWCCDIAATVAIVNSGRSKVERAMHLMYSLFVFLPGQSRCSHSHTEHICEVENGAADALSRDNHQDFFLQVPQARQEPQLVPAVDGALCVVLGSRGTQTQVY